MSNAIMRMALVCAGVFSVPPPWYPSIKRLKLKHLAKGSHQFDNTRPPAKPGGVA